MVVIKNQTKKRKKVFVAMSGGVDSSVAAALLKKQNYAVTGVFIKVWQPDFVECQWREDRLDAMRVCALLDIPFLDLDLKKEYKKEIFDYMVKEYKNGKTPNPDVMCNQKIKFGAFLNFALKNRADFIATGHYARFENPNKNGQSRKLLAGIDKEKDQSYFLWSLTQKQLKHCLFPIGGYTKLQVRKMARKFGLPVAQKKDSQGLCFVGKVDMKKFLQRFIPQKQGNVLNQKGEIIGKHDGIYYYTIGQRHGFTITKKGTDDKPYYIIGKNLKNNILTVSPCVDVRCPSESLGQRMSKSIQIKDSNWIGCEVPALDKKYSARIRYRQALQDCRFQRNGRKIFVKFDKAQNTAKGQSIVVYDNEICLGGGVVV